MRPKDPRVDEYIAQAAPFARPILRHLRKVMHAGCPGLQETIKWNFPHFEYKGVLGGMGAFKQHCSFGLWKAALIFDGPSNNERNGMGHFGKITSIADLPAEKTLIGYVKKAAELNDAGIKSPERSKPKKGKKDPLVVPDYLTAALKQNKKVRTTFDGFNCSQRKEYIEWLTEARPVETREQRFATTLEWLAEGKPRNWKYQRK
jgi:uncharacterized protein YdeI (YjbR/CyaY-like superfamily)